MGISTYEGRVILFNNGVVDVKQGDVSLVDSERVAHIPEGNVAIDNLTIIRNAEQELEVPFDNQTIYRDTDGFIKARGGSGETYTAGEHITIDSENVISAEWPVIPEPIEYSAGEHISIDSENTISAEWPTVSDHKVILCTKVGDEPAGPVGSFTLNQNSDKTITIPIPEPEVKEYTGGTDIEITSEGVINYTGSGSSVVVDNDTIITSEGAIKVNEDKFIVKEVKPAFSFEENTFTYDTENTIWNGSLPFTQELADTICDKFTVDNEIPIKVDIYHDGLTEPLSKVCYSSPNATQYNMTSFDVSFILFDAEEHETDISLRGEITGDGSQWTGSAATVYAMTYGDSDPVSTFSSVEKVIVSLPEFATFKVNPSNLPEKPDESDYKWGIYYDGDGNIKVEQGQYGNAYQTADEVSTAISNQTEWMADSINQLERNKQDVLHAGNGISIEDSTISATVTLPIVRLGYGTPTLTFNNTPTIVEDTSDYIITGEGSWRWVGSNRLPDLYDTVTSMSPAAAGQGAFFITHMQLMDENDNAHVVLLLDTTLGNQDYDSDKDMDFVPAYFSKGEDEGSTQITADGVIKFYSNNTAEITLPKAYCSGYTLKNENTVITFMLPVILNFNDSNGGDLYHSLLPGYSRGYWTVSYTGERNTNI